MTDAQCAAVHKHFEGMDAWDIVGRMPQSVNFAALLAEQFQNPDVTSVDMFSESGLHWNTVSREEFNRVYAPWLAQQRAS